MLESANLNGTGTDPLRARFGVAAGTQSPEVERQQWEQLCRELLQEREQLKTALADMKVERDAALDLYSDEVLKSFPATQEEAFAQMIFSPSILEILDEIEREPTAPQP